MLSNWLQPIAIGQFSNFRQLDKQHFAKKILIYTNKLPGLKNIQVALISTDEEAAHPIRSALYEMMFPFRNLRFADLGNTRKNERSFLIPLFNELLESNILPIIIGKDGAVTLAQYQAYQARQQLINVAWVGDRIPIKPEVKKSGGYVNQMIYGRKPQLFNLGLIAYQSHYTSDAITGFLQNQNWDMLRLGQTRQYMEDVEPVIRDADMMSFHIPAIRQSDAPDQLNPSPSGLMLEEACQISRYAGLSDKLSSVGFYSFQESDDPSQQTAQCIAQLIWYFLDGYANRHNDYPATTQGMVEYIVNWKGNGDQLTFWKSSKSGRWWMQIPLKVKKKQKRHHLIPCSYLDYQQTCNEELPDRLLNAYRRFA